jgi:serine phosphatase RsbU (regulator of sigma subunit)
MLAPRLLTTAVLCGLLVAAIFAVEIITPRGIAETTLYLVVVFLALRAQNTFFIIAVAAACSVLTILGFFLSPTDAIPPAFSVANRGFSLLGIWIVASVGLLMQASEAGRRRLQRQLDQTEEQFRLAQKIQQKLFPSGAPRLAGFDIAGVCHPANATGGDYFDFIPMSGGSLGIAVGDVSSHGFGPALLMAEVHAAIRALALAHIDAGEILTLANRLVCEDTADEQFVTVFLGSLDPDERTFVYASAGQQGFLLDGSGAMTKLDSTGFPLGVDAAAVIDCAPRIHLDDGCFVLLFTDGVFEAMDRDGRSFGIERAFDIVRANRDRPAATVVELLCQAVRAFSENGCQSDDITAVIVKAQPVAVPLGSDTETSVEKKKEKKKCQDPFLGP